MDANYEDRLFRAIVRIIDGDVQRSDIRAILMNCTSKELIMIFKDVTNITYQMIAARYDISTTSCKNAFAYKRTSREVNAAVRAFLLMDDTIAKKTEMLINVANQNEIPPAMLNKAEFLKISGTRLKAIVFIMPESCVCSNLVATIKKYAPRDVNRVFNWTTHVIFGVTKHHSILEYIDSSFRTSPWLTVATSIRDDPGAAEAMIAMLILNLHIWLHQHPNTKFILISKSNCAMEIVEQVRQKGRFCDLLIAREGSGQNDFGQVFEMASKEGV